MLADPDQMDLRAEESAALYDTVRPLFDGTGFAAEPLNARRWRLRLPEGLRPATASPLAVAGRRLNDWWKQDAETRPWRRLLNEIQMAARPSGQRGARARVPSTRFGCTAAPALAHRAARTGADPDGLDAPQRAGDWPPAGRAARAGRSCAPGPASKACPTPRPNYCCWATTAASPSP